MCSWCILIWLPNLTVELIRATTAAMAFLKAGGTAVDAVEVALTVLEDNPITNAGYGSNLNHNGIVECDASIVDHRGKSGAVGAVPSKFIMYLAECVSRRFLIWSVRREEPNRARPKDL